MGNLHRSLAAATASLFMIQDVCAAKPNADIIPPGMSLVHAQGSSLRSFLKVLKPIGTTMVVYILSVDGKKAKLSGSQREVIIQPGLHNLAIRCDFTVDSLDRSAGGSYQPPGLRGGNRVPEGDGGLRHSPRATARAVARDAPVLSDLPHSGALCRDAS